jgi:hypothetical protein
MKFEDYHNEVYLLGQRGIELPMLKPYIDFEYDRTREFNHSDNEEEKHIDHSPLDGISLSLDFNNSVQDISRVVDSHSSSDIERVFESVDRMVMTETDTESDMDSDQISYESCESERETFERKLNISRTSSGESIVEFTICPKGSLGKKRKRSD